MRPLPRHRSTLKSHADCRIEKTQCIIPTRENQAALEPIIENFATPAELNAFYRLRSGSIDDTHVDGDNAGRLLWYECDLDRLFTEALKVGLEMGYSYDEILPHEQVPLSFVIQDRSNSQHAGALVDTIGFYQRVDGEWHELQPTCGTGLIRSQSGGAEINEDQDDQSAEEKTASSTTAPILDQHGLTLILQDVFSLSSDAGEIEVNTTREGAEDCGLDRSVLRKKQSVNWPRNKGARAIAYLGQKAELFHVPPELHGIVADGVFYAEYANKFSTFVPF